MSESFFEYAALHDNTRRSPALRIDRAAHRLRGVKILGFNSTNGRTYELEAVRRALPLYEGARVNINHPPGVAPAPRDYHDRLGSLVEVRLDEAQGLFGDLFYNPKHPLAEQLLWDAEHAPQNVGLSHNVLARTTRRGDQTAVTEIVAVVSVDLVADPATTRGLFEEQEAAVSDPQPTELNPVGEPTAAEPRGMNPRGLGEEIAHSTDQAASDEPEQSELDTLREQLTAALLREARLREELERRRDVAPRCAVQLPRSREQAAESLQRSPKLTREQTLHEFIAAVRGKK